MLVKIEAIVLSTYILHVIERRSNTLILLNILMTCCFALLFFRL